MSTALADRLEGAAREVAHHERSMERAEEEFATRFRGHPAKREVLRITSTLDRQARDDFAAALLDLMKH